MLMLAVSTSSAAPSAALYREGGIIKLKKDESGKPHSVSLMKLIDELVSEEGADISDIDLLAVDVGPGSFTGVRIGVSVVNALAYALDKPVIPVCSLNALRNIKNTDTGSVLSIIDSRNGNGYAALFENGLCTLEPCACVQDEMLKTITESTAIVGNCFGRSDSCDAELVIREALREGARREASATPLYLRPSQAERMRAESK